MCNFYSLYYLAYINNIWCRRYSPSYIFFSLLPESQTLLVSYFNDFFFPSVSFAFLPFCQTSVYCWSTKGSKLGPLYPTEKYVIHRPPGFKYPILWYQIHSFILNLSNSNGLLDLNLVCQIVPYNLTFSKSIL